MKHFQHPALKQSYANRIVIADLNATAVTSKVYTTIQAAIDYAVTQTPSATSPWLVVIKPGIYTEKVTCSAYVDMVGEGRVTITSTETTCTLIPASNTRLMNLTITNTGDGGAVVKNAAAVTGLLYDHVDMVGSGTCVDGLYGISGTIDGIFQHCLLESPFDAAYLSAATKLQFFDCRFYGYQVADDNRASACLILACAGTIEFENCLFEADIMTAATNKAYGLGVLTANGQTVRVTNSRFRLSGVNNNSGNYGVSAEAASGTTANVFLRNCHIKSTKTGVANTNRAVSVTGASCAVTMVGGSTLVSGGATVYDALQSAGTLTMQGVQTGGSYSGTITYSGELASNAFRSGVTNAAPFLIASTSVCTNLNADMVDGQHASSFAASAHDLTGTAHTDSGLTSGQVLQATASTAFSWLGLAHTSLTTVGANDHHNQIHNLAGTDHTASGLVAGQVLRASASTAAAFAVLTVPDLPSGSPYFLTPPWGLLAGANVMSTVAMGYWSPVRAPIDGVVTKLGCAVLSTTGATIMMAINADAGGIPGVNLGATASTNAIANQFNEYALLANVNVTHDAWYWLGVMCNTTAAGTLTGYGQNAVWCLGGTYAMKRVANAAGWGSWDGTAATTPTAANGPGVVGIMV